MQNNFSLENEFDKSKIFNHPIYTLDSYQNCDEKDNEIETVENLSIELEEVKYNERNAITEEVTPYEETPKKQGRKRNNSLIKGNHSKFSPDNMQKKIKSKVLSSTMIFINKKIEKIYQIKSKNNKKKNQLKQIPHDTIKNTNIKFNQQLLNNSLLDIFSVDISTKNKNFKKSFNKDLIQRLINDKNEENKIYFTNLFNIKFVQCIEHIRNSKNYDELNGLLTLDQWKKEYKYDSDYFYGLSNTINDFEGILQRKRGRKKKK
jgi:hypothetical protein